MKCIVDLDGVESADMAPDTSYYQWVTFMFAIQVKHNLIHITLHHNILVL